MLSLSLLFDLAFLSLLVSQTAATANCSYYQSSSGYRRAHGYCATVKTSYSGGPYVSQIWFCDASTPNSTTWNMNNRDVCSSPAQQDGDFPNNPELDRYTMCAPEFEGDNNQCAVYYREYDIDENTGCNGTSETGALFQYTEYPFVYDFCYSSTHSYEGESYASMYIQCDLEPAKATFLYFKSEGCSGATYGDWRDYDLKLESDTCYFDSNRSAYLKYELLACGGQSNYTVYIDPTDGAFVALPMTGIAVLFLVFVSL